MVILAWAVEGQMPRHVSSDNLTSQWAFASENLAAYETHQWDEA